MSDVSGVDDLVLMCIVRAVEQSQLKLCRIDDDSVAKVVRLSQDP